MKRAAELAVLLQALLILAAITEATSLAPLTVEQLTGVAEVIVRARCAAAHSQWDRGEIWTFTQFDVFETLKGRAPAHITVRLIGGQVGHVNSIVAQVPRFRPGEEVVLFLERMDAANFSVTAWSVGTFRVRREFKTGTRVVSQDLCGHAAFDPRTRQFRCAGLCNLSVEAFEKRIAAATRRTGANPR